MRFLLYKWKVFNQEDIKAALERAGHEVHVFNAVDFVREKQEEIENMLAEKFARYDIVFSVNYFQEVSGCLHEGREKVYFMDCRQSDAYDVSRFCIQSLQLHIYI